MSEGNFLKGLIIGGLIGAVSALLLAPKSGKETRADICNRTEELITFTKKEYDKGLEKSSEVFDTLKNTAANLESQSLQGAGRLKQAMAAGLKAYHEAKNE